MQPSMQLSLICHITVVLIYVHRKLKSCLNIFIGLKSKYKYWHNSQKACNGIRKQLRTLAACLIIVGSLNQRTSSPMSTLIETSIQKETLATATSLAKAMHQWFRLGDWQVSAITSAVAGQAMSRSKVKGNLLQVWKAKPLQGCLQGKPSKAWAWPHELYVRPIRLILGWLLYASELSTCILNW